MSIIETLEERLIRNKLLEYPKKLRRFDLQLKLTIFKIKFIRIRLTQNQRLFNLHRSFT